MRVLARTAAALVVLPVFALLADWLPQAAATSLSVAPTRIELAPGTRSGAVMLDNTGAAATTVQVETFAWTRGNSIEELEPTRGLLAVPAVFNLAAGERQVIRVASRSTTPDDIETAYRLVISEVPTSAPGTGTGVRFALRLSLPVFITPPGAKAEPRWSFDGNGGSRTLVVENAGRAHLHVRRLTVKERTSRRVVKELDQPAYVLARAAHRWPGLVPASAGPVLIEADTNLGRLTLDIDG